jgi:hypothetical protein
MLVYVCVSGGCAEACRVLIEVCGADVAAGPGGFEICRVLIETRTAGTDAQCPGT